MTSLESLLYWAEVYKKVVKFWEFLGLVIAIGAVFSLVIILILNSPIQALHCKIMPEASRLIRYTEIGLGLISLIVLIKILKGRIEC